MVCSQNCTELLLCVLFGFLGVHKFYIGNWKCGLFYVFTLGFALLAVCVDVFLIIYFWKEEEEEINIENELRGKKGNLNREKLLLYSTANDSIINYKYTSNKGKSACAVASGLCLWLSILLTILMVVFFVWPFIDTNYYSEDYSEMKYEKSYIRMKDLVLNEKEIAVDNKERKKQYNHIKLYYPKLLESQDNKEHFPIIIFANPEGVSYEKYESVFKHLASYGFVSVGNDDIRAEVKTLPNVIDELHQLNNNDGIFKDKFNLNEIGVIGYYQGAIPVIKLLTNFPYNNSIGAAYVSCLRQYELEKKDLFNIIQSIYTPFFQTGPNKPKDNVYINIMKEVSNKFPSDTETISVLRKNKEEGSMIIYGDAYMTAWFDYKLKRKKELKEVFSSNGEIFNQKGNWTNIKDIK